MWAKWIFFFPMTSLAGWPVIDVQQSVESAYESAATASAASDLLGEFGQSSQVLEDIAAMHQDIKDVDELIRDVNRYSEDIDSLSKFEIDRYRKLSKKIKYATHYIKRMKKITGIAAVATSAKAATAIHQMEQTKLIGDQILMSERREIEDARREIKRIQAELERKKKERAFWNREFQAINQSSRRSGMGNYSFFNIKEIKRGEEPGPDNNDDFSYLERLRKRLGI